MLPPECSIRPEGRSASLELPKDSPSLEILRLSGPEDILSFSRTCSQISAAPCMDVSLWTPASLVGQLHSAAVMEDNKVVIFYLFGGELRVQSF
ncbi:hypothetical protein GH714_043272 [Hevea brasiliensis]|uniref:Uncharacterized protein n=1 Tax=Hevea brasiliensis TaxID=3981 RepID=A0A6A6K3G0_HEVBR|nr:hypothetical protein GH714_043272 [Hevea brasiliensis]